jgi:hypothetical protein
MAAERTLDAYVATLPDGQREWQFARMASPSTGAGYSRAAGPRCHAAVHLAQYRLSAGWPGGSGAPQLAPWPGTVRVASSSTGAGCFRAAAPANMPPCTLRNTGCRQAGLAPAVSRSWHSGSGRSRAGPLVFDKYVHVRGLLDHGSEASARPSSVLLPDC